jgi:hypothetical protein
MCALIQLLSNYEMFPFHPVQGQILPIWTNIIERHLFLKNVFWQGYPHFLR